MRRLLNKLLVKFGLLITKAPTLLADKSLDTSDLFPTDLTEKTTIKPPSGGPGNNELFTIFESDTNVHKWYHYFDIYTRYFERYRDGPIRMLEIGVFRGGSLRMWKQYFHPESRIVGIDIDPSCSAHEIADQDIHVRIGSQADPEFLAKVNEEFGPFDIILDDGSHMTHHQIVSFGALFRPALKEGGCYMVEDCHSNYWQKHIDSPETFIEVAKQVVDLLHEPYIDRVEPNFRLGYPDAIDSADVTYLSANVDGVYFHDSIVVFDKKHRDLPRNEQR